MNRVHYSPMSPGTQFFFGKIFPIIFILVGAGIVIAGCRSLLQANASKSWPSTQGVIQHSTVKSSSGESGETYHAEIKYEFTVDSAPHTGSRVAFGDYGSSNPAHARGIVDRYPKGKAVLIYYDPSRLENSVLEPGVKGQAWAVPAVGLAFLVAGSFASVAIPKTMRESVAAQRKLHV